MLAQQGEDDAERRVREQGGRLLDTGGTGRGGEIQTRGGDRYAALPLGYYLYYP